MSSSDIDQVEFLERLQFYIQDETGLHAHFVQPVIRRVFDRIRREHAGQALLFSHRDPFRRQQALSLFDGSNHDEVCRRVEISRRTLDRYLRAQG